MYAIQQVQVTLQVDSIEATAAWYERVLGWRAHFDVFDGDGRCAFGSVGMGGPYAGGPPGSSFVGVNLMRDESAPAPGMAQVWLTVDSVDDVYQRVLAAGVTPDAPPVDQFWGERIFTMRDFNGLTLRFVQAIEAPEIEEIRRRHTALTAGSE